MIPGIVRRRDDATELPEPAMLVRTPPSPDGVVHDVVADHHGRIDRPAPLIQIVPIWDTGPIGPAGPTCAAKRTPKAIGSGNACHKSK